MCCLTLWNRGAVVASPTFSLPEYIGGTRNWYVRDYMLVVDSVQYVFVGIIGMFHVWLSSSRRKLTSYPARLGFVIPRSHSMHSSVWALRMKLIVGPVVNSTNYR
jgi:hypothetical protein